ncbi:MAG: serine hydrolase, partial [Firmicutes bacterium]|nr:serine hydrolase [Bacillota bacterium]
MITVSDNDAANALVKALGNGDASKGMAKVNAYCEKYEYDMTHMGRLLLAPNTKDDNYTSVNDCAHFLEKVYNHSIPGAEKIEQLLLQQKRISKIPAGIPKGIKVGNKTGELSNVENDAAIVYLQDNPYILCVMSEKLSSSDAARKAIVNLSKEICIYMKNPY